MAQVLLPGFGLVAGANIPVIDMSQGATGFTSATIAATGDKITMSGRVWTPSRTTKDISRVGFRWGAVTKAGGSAMTVSLQDVDLTAGPPVRPDGTQDQTVAVANADAGFVSNTWYRTNALSANRTVIPGDWLSVVIEFDGAGRLGSDSVAMSMIIAASTNTTNLTAQPVTQLSGVWAVVATTLPNLVLEFSDGTFGTLGGSLCASSFTAQAFKQDSGTDEFALAFQNTYPCKVDGAWVSMTLAANTSDFNVVLYDGTTAMTGGTVSFDANTVAVSPSRFLFVPFSQEITLVANHQYYLSLQPTQTTSTVSVHYATVANANHLSTWPGGTAYNYATRSDLGAWTATTTNRVIMGLNISSVDDGTSGGGGAILYNPGMSGGMAG